MSQFALARFVRTPFEVTTTKVMNMFIWRTLFKFVVKTPTK